MFVNYMYWVFMAKTITLPQGGTGKYFLWMNKISK